ncbi:hypothetical protein CNR22_02155 [Sphingobacteriaceae bacterium]|nr:hypothetical protein CNR22_02155 [Sphingobacteriaceae bacterium]
MATVLPFKALRPAGDKVHLVASRSVDGYNTPELKDKLAGNPYTFLHVINPDYDDGVRTRPGSKERLTKIKRKFDSFIKEKILKRDEKAAYYIYRQIKGENEYIGIIACTSIDDYMNGVIKIHEQTITQREEKLKEYLEVCEFNAEPVLFCYPNDKVLDDLILSISESVPTYDFTTTDKVRHTLWVVSHDKNVEIISGQFSKIPAIYIADGHHRSASSALLGSVLRKSKKAYTGKEAFNYYLGVFFAETQLKIFDYNRLVKDMGDLTVPELLKRLKTKFEVKEINEKVFKPTRKHEISMYTKDKWYALTAKEGTYNSSDAVGSLDASILTEHILSPLFDIHDLKIDKRIGFVPGIKGAETLKRSVDEGKAEVAFGLYPVTMEHLKWIADTNNIMPPKSTWVEPKMRSGLVIYSFDE